METVENRDGVVVSGGETHAVARFYYRDDGNHRAVCLCGWEEYGPMTILFELWRDHARLSY